jgi:hypothetical protein
MEARIIAPDWVEAYSLTETGAVEKVRHEGEEAERICQEVKRGGAPGSRGGGESA